MDARTIRGTALLALALATIGAGGPLGGLPLIPNTAALYPFDEGAGTTATDASGHNHTGNLMAGVAPEWVEGQSDAALEFSVATSYLSVDPVTVGPNWTIQAWIRLPLAGDYTYRYIACSDNDLGFFAHVALTNGQLGVWTDLFAPFSGSGFDVDTLPEGWHLISAVGSGGKTSFYVDGDPDPVGVSEAQVTAPVALIGGVPNLNASLGGAIDALRILTTARTGAEIAADSIPPTPPDPPANPAQFTLSGSPLPEGGVSPGGFTAKATLTGENPPHRLQLEVKPAGVSFDGSGLTSGAGVSAGSPASVTVTGLPPGPYHWRARGVDDGGASDWVTFGTGPVAFEITAATEPAAEPEERTRPACGASAPDAAPVILVLAAAFLLRRRR